MKNNPVTGTLTKKRLKVQQVGLGTFAKAQYKENTQLGVRSESRVCRFPIQFFVQILQKNGEYLDI